MRRIIDIRSRWFQLTRERERERAAKHIFHMLSKKKRHKTKKNPPPPLLRRNERLPSFLLGYRVFSSNSSRRSALWLCPIREKTNNNRKKNSFFFWGFCFVCFVFLFFFKKKERKMTRKRTKKADTQNTTIGREQPFWLLLLLLKCFIWNRDNDFFFSLRLRFRFVIHRFAYIRMLAGHSIGWRFFFLFFFFCGKRDWPLAPPQIRPAVVVCRSTCRAIVSNEHR